MNSLFLFIRVRVTHEHQKMSFRQPRALFRRVSKCLSDCAESVPVWSGPDAVTRRGEKAAFLLPPTPYWAEADTNPLLMQGPFLASPSSASRTFSPGLLSSMSALHVVSTWAPSSPLQFLALAGNEAADWKLYAAEELCFIFLQKRSCWASALSHPFSPEHDEGPQKGCGSGCLLWTKLHNVLRGHLEIKFWPVS